MFRTVNCIKSCINKCIANCIAASGRRGRWLGAVPAGFSLSLLLLSPGSLHAVAQGGEAGWSLKFNEDGIRTYTRAREGSKLLEARHIAITPVRMGRVLPELGDGSECIAWMQRCKRAELLVRENDSSFLGYVVLNMPWPLSDRDLVYRSTKKQGVRGALVIEQQAAPEAHPATSLVRMDSQNRFVLTPTDEGGTRIVWEVFSDPGGNVSPKMINGKMPKETRGDMQRLLKLLQKKYPDS